MIVGRYAPGGRQAVITDHGLVVLGAEVPLALLERVWQQAAAGRGLPAVLEALTGAFGTSLAAIPPFAVVLQEEAGVRIVVRGSLDVAVETATGTEDMSGAGVTTWTERIVAGARRITVVAGTADAPAEYPVRDGIVLVSVISVELDGTTDAAPSRPAAAPAVAAAPVVSAAPSADAVTRIPAESAAPELGDTVSLAPVAQAAPEPVTDVPPAPSPVTDPHPTPEPVTDVPVEPAAEPEADEPAADPVTDVPTAPEEPSSSADPEPAPPLEDVPEVVDESPVEAEPAASVVEDTPLVEEKPDAPVEAPMLIDSTAVLTMTGADTLLPGDSTFARTDPQAVRAAEVDSEWAATIARPATAATGAPSEGDHDGATISVAEARRLRGVDSDSTPPPLAPPRPPAPGKVRLSTGQVLLLDRTVVIGRRPRSTRVVGTDLPHLVAVDSPEQDISRSHVELRVEGDSVVATDLHTTNGTTLHRSGSDPMRLHPGEATVVVPGDLLDLGDGITVTIEDLA